MRRYLMTSYGKRMNKIIHTNITPYFIIITQGKKWWVGAWGWSVKEAIYNTTSILRNQWRRTYLVKINITFGRQMTGECCGGIVRIQRNLNVTFDLRLIIAGYQVPKPEPYPEVKPHKYVINSLTLIFVKVRNLIIVQHHQMLP